MKRYSGLVKNIILVVASALTLVAVSFAWFTTNTEMTFENFESAIEGEMLSVEYYIADENDEYQLLEGDIELNDAVAGDYNKYKLMVTTKTADELMMNFNIIGLPDDMSQELKDNVCINFRVCTTRKAVASDGTVSYKDVEQIATSNGYVPLSQLNDGNIITGLSLGNYQQAAGDKFVIYYEIGLSEDAPESLGGVESSLGSLRVSAQRTL